MRYAFTMNAHKVLSHHYLTIFNIHTPSAECTVYTVHSQSVSLLASASASAPDQDSIEHCIIIFKHRSSTHICCLALHGCWLLVYIAHLFNIFFFMGKRMQNANYDLQVNQCFFFNFSSCFFAFCISFRFIGRLHLPLCEHWLWMRCKFVFTYDRTPFWP